MNLTLELLAGALLALLGVALVLEPLIRSNQVVEAPPADPSAVDEWDADIAVAATPRARALAALREIEFDRETGKLDDKDYETLKARYTREAIEAMRTEEATPEVVTPAATAAVAVDEADPLDALAEAAISDARARGSVPRGNCPTCGPRPERGAAFCSNCGRPLAA